MPTAESTIDTARIPSATFESIAVERGLVTPTQVAECRALLQMLVDMGLSSTIAEVFQKKGLLDAQQVAAIEIALGRSSAVVIPGYEIVAKIAEGGMGAVYKAHQTSMDRFVAIKVLLPKFAEDKEGRERFVREARAVAKLSHPNVVAGIDAGVAHGICWFVMEFLDGEPLDQTVRRRGALPWREATELIRQTARALEHAHRHGIVHRDIKPGNIIVLRDGTAKLADLGLARVAESADATLTQSGMIVGSPAYLSPEQATGDRPVDVRSDIFSLGLTYFELVAGERAYAGSNPMSIMTALLTREVPLDKLRAIDAPAGVAAVIAKMAQREPERRYQAPDTLIEDLEALLADAAPAHALARAAVAPTPSRPRAWLVPAGALVLAVAIVAWFMRGSPVVPPPAPAAPKSDPVATAPAAPKVETLAPAAGVRMDLVGAIERAQREAPDAPAYHAELERDEYSIDLVQGNRTLNVLIDAKDGRVKRKIEEDENHSADVEVARVTLARAIAIAEQKAGASAVDSGIVLLPGRAVIEVKLLRGGKPVWIEVDAVTSEASGERLVPRRE